MNDITQIIQSPKLPSLPAAAARLLDLLQDPDSGVRDMVDVIKTDPALTARILQAANASSLGVSRSISSIELAVPLLGKTVVTTLTLNFSLLSKRSLGPGGQELLDDYWLGAVIHANAAQQLSSFVKVPGEELFLGGLLADVGRLAMIATSVEDYLRVTELRETDDLSDTEAERTVFGFTHADVGEILAKKWGLPAELTTAIATHHNEPTEQLWSQAASPLAKATNIAAIATDLLKGRTDPTLLERFNAGSRHLLGICEGEARQYLVEAHATTEKVAELLAADTSSLDDVETILARATEKLVQITLEAQKLTEQTLADKEELERKNRALENRNRELLERATRDELTGLPNRHFLTDFISAEWQRCFEERIPLGIILADIDHFKSVNDTYGHQAGDAVLRAVAAVIDKVTRRNDIVARYGGEEFVLVAPSVGVEDLGFIAERFRSAVSESMVVLPCGQEIQVTVSVGGAYVVPQRHFTHEQLIEAADKAMYVCKQQGRNRCKVTHAISDELVTV